MFGGRFFGRVFFGLRFFGVGYQHIGPQSQPGLPRMGRSVLFQGWLTWPPLNRSYKEFL